MEIAYSVQGAVKWLNRIDGNDRLKFAPLQGETAGRYEIDLSDDSMAFAETRKISIGQAKRRGRAFWNAGGGGIFLAFLIMALPIALRDWGYQWIAKNRKHLVKK